MPCMPVPGECRWLRASLKSPSINGRQALLGTQGGPIVAQRVSIHLPAPHSRPYTATLHSGGQRRVWGALCSSPSAMEHGCLLHKGWECFREVTLRSLPHPKSSPGSVYLFLREFSLSPSFFYISTQWGPVAKSWCVTADIFCGWDSLGF